MLVKACNCAESTLRNESRSRKRAFLTYVELPPLLPQCHGIEPLTGLGLTDTAVPGWYVGWGWRGRVGHGQARRGSGKRNGTRTTWRPNWRRGRPGSAVTTHHEQVERSQHTQHTHTNTSRRQAGPLLAARVRGRRQMSYGRQFPMRNTPRPREEDRRGASPRPHGCARAGRHHASRSSTHASALPPRLSEDEGTASRSARRAMPRYNLSPTEALALPPRETRRIF